MCYNAWCANWRQTSVRFTHNRDIVPAWPPTWVGFHHVATEIWQVDFGLGSVRINPEAMLHFAGKVL